MKRAIHKLTDVACRNAKPGKRPYRKSDGGGLYLLVSPTGAKSWQFRYRHAGSEQVATLGRYDLGMSLIEVRAAADEARKHSGRGEHLTTVKRVKRAEREASNAATFGALKSEWVTDESRRAGWSDDYRGEVEASLRNHLADLDALPVTSITAAICAKHMRPVEAKAPDMARKVRQRLWGILQSAVESGVIAFNPLPAKRRGPRIERTHHAAVIDAHGVGEILRAADKVEACKGVRRAHLIAVFTAQRIGVIADAPWSEFDLDAATWTTPRERIKMHRMTSRGDHVIPLPPYLLAQLREWKRTDGDAEYVCPAPRGNGHVTREAVEKFYRRTLGLSGKHSPHSWRTVMKSWAADHGEEPDLAQSCLDHGIGNKVDQSYDQAQRLDRRREFVERHEARLIAARDGAKVVPLRKTRRA